MPDSVGTSSSFSSATLRVPGARVSRKRPHSQEQQVRRIRRRKSDYKRIDVGESIDDDLCKRCRKIDFEAIYEIEPDETITDHGTNVYDLGELAPFSKHTRCKVCSLFAFIIKHNQEYEPPFQGDWHLRAFTAGTLRNRSHATASRAQDLSIVIALSEKSDSLSRSDVVACIDRGVILPWYDRLGLSSDSQGGCRLTPCPKKIDYDRIGELLLSCDSDHRKCRERQETNVSFPVGARVIDCKTREISALTSESVYVALSYVWGPQPAGESSEHLAKPMIVAPQPTTIENAISITKSLGL